MVRHSAERQMLQGTIWEVQPLKWKASNGIRKAEARVKGKKKGVTWKGRIFLVTRS